MGARTHAHDETIETRQKKKDPQKNPVFGFVKIQMEYTEG